MKTIVAQRALFMATSLFFMAAACTNPVPTPTAEPTPTPDPTPTPTTTPTAIPAPSPSPTPEATPTPDADGIIWYEPNPATITVEGSTIIFDGDIEEETYRHFLLAVDDKEDQITAIRINSGGGITDQGMWIGKWIFDHELDVIVDELCFSSCANYIFTAGKNKIIGNDAIVGWHGSEQQDQFIAAGLGLTMRDFHAWEYDRSKEFGGPSTPQESKEEYVENMLKWNEYERADDEPEFLERIGVNLYLMVYGFLPDQIDYYFNEQTEFGGWTFSIEDMAKFGVENVTYEGEGNYPSKRALENHPVAVFNVPTDTVPPAEVPTPIPEPTPPPGSTLTLTPEPEPEDSSDQSAELIPAEITVEGDTVVIDGYLNHNAFIRFRSEIVGIEDEIAAVRINSDFGLTHQAILIGFWIYDNDIDVVVDGVCISACANYIFTAGKNKIIEDFALVGWRDSPQGQEYEARSLGISVEELIERDVSADPSGTGAPISERELEQIVQDSVDYFESGIEQERQFLDWIGLQEDALVYGFLDVDFDAEFLPLHLFEGWTFSIEDMAKLGIENATYESDHEYPSLLSTIERNVTVFDVP